MFTRVLRQWRCNSIGPIGLDYNVFPFMFTMLGITDLEEQQELFECVRVMEKEALDVFSENNEG